MRTEAAVFLIAFAASACRPASGPRTGTAAEKELERQALQSVPPQPFRDVCSGGAVHCLSKIRTDESGQVRMFIAPADAGYGPPDLASAYQLNTSAPSTALVAIVDAYGYTNAESDLATYRSSYGLPPCSVASGCLTIVNGSGQTSPLPAPPTSVLDDWTIETALDLDMASAACPNCKLLLVQVTDDTSTSNLLLGVDTAVALGATVVSNSWGWPDTTGEAPSDEVYLDHPGAGIFVASGDTGYDDGSNGPDIPSTSAYVTAVGGTTLVPAPGTTRGWAESAWSLSPTGGATGSSCSTTIPVPSWQSGLFPSTVCGFRATNEVSSVGDPNTGLNVYNNGPSSAGWIVVGGTSAASPFVAAVFALTGHAVAGPAFSYANASAFNDVTTGSNGSCGNVLCNAGPGWDGPTGNGTPIGSALAAIGCTPSCGGKQCGTDGCSGSCGGCPSGESCNPSGQCVAACAGCVDGSGACQAGTAANACGVLGATCQSCVSPQICSNGACATAPCSGCIDANGICQPGTTTSACGAGGGGCAVCGTGQSCTGGSCVTASCGGCIDASGACQPGTAASDCGVGGVSCAVCGAGQGCSGGNCVTPACAGCVDAFGQCQAGSSNGACGLGGVSCTACGSGQICSGGGCVLGCGCIDASGACQPGTAASDCGAGGGTCVACGSGQLCSNGACTAPGCSGCVDGSGICQEGTAPAACGTGGVACAVCPAGDVCADVFVQGSPVEERICGVPLGP
ncbi:MAG: S53 family peptidase [Myxococcales bacterium]